MTECTAEQRLQLGCQPALATWANEVRQEPLMWLNTDRVMYVGLLGEPSERSFGSYVVYLSIAKSHRLSVAGGTWEEGELSVIPPYVPHRIASGERMICCLLIEADSVDDAKLPDFLRLGSGVVEAPRMLARMRHAIACFRGRATKQYARSADFDMEFFGEALASRALDGRIQAALQRIKREPNSHTSAQDFAEQSHLSVSRFLHLFKADAGASFRSYRAWQRARSVLYYVTLSESLANIALDVGYPDSSHFSHSIRQTYGLTPRSIFAGSRKLELHRAHLTATAVQ